MFLSPHITSIPTIMPSLFTSSLRNDRGGWENRLTGIHKICHPVHLIFEIFLCEVTLWWASHGTHSFLAQCETCPYISSPNFIVNNFLNMFKSLTTDPKHWPEPMNQYIITCLTTSLSSKVNNYMHCPKFCPLGGFPLPTVRHRCPTDKL